MNGCKMPSNTLVSGTPQKNDQTKRNTGLFVSFLDSGLISMLFRRLSYLIMRLKANATLKVSKGTVASSF